MVHVWIWQSFSTMVNISNIWYITVFFVRVACKSLALLQLFSLILNCFSTKCHFLFWIFSFLLFQEGLKILLSLIYFIFFCCLILAPRLMSSGTNYSALALWVPFIFLNLFCYKKTQFTVIFNKTVHFSKVNRILNHETRLTLSLLLCIGL